MDHHHSTKKNHHKAHKPLVCGYDEEYLEKAFKPSVEAESPGSQKEPPEMKRTSDTVI